MMAFRIKNPGALKLKGIVKSVSKRERETLHLSWGSDVFDLSQFQYIKVGGYTFKKMRGKQ
jgi:hypothetical protein